MKTVIIVQARMTSTRLPGKVLKTVLGKTLLEYLFDRLDRVALADGFMVATTTNDTDEPIVDLCRRCGVEVWRGSEADVLSRYHGAATVAQADTVVRITSDCPLLDPMIVDDAIAFFRQNRDRFDYVSNALRPGYPLGMAVEVFHFEALHAAHQEAADAEEREHVTPFIYRRPDRYRIGHLEHVHGMEQHRWTVDTQEDFELVSRILEALMPAKPEFTLQDIVATLKENPEWSLLNAHVMQKKLSAPAQQGNA